MVSVGPRRSTVALGGGAQSAAVGHPTFTGGAGREEEEKKEKKKGKKEREEREGPGLGSPAPVRPPPAEPVSAGLTPAGHRRPAKHHKKNSSETGEGKTE